MVPQASPRILPISIPRPPTPPRESDRPYSFDRGPSKEITSQRSTNLTPDSSAESPTQTSATSRKKVNWPTNGDTTLSPIVQTLPGSGDRKPIKSILKPYNGVNIQGLNLGTTTKISPPHAYPNLAAMLESIAQQLAGEDRNSKMDAYTTLSGSIRASDNVPELRALKEKMGLLLQFMKRDLTAKTTTGSPDTPLIVNDLILLSSFLHKKAIADLVSNDFSTYLVDHSIKSFEDSGMSKEVVKHLMFILAQQNFSPKIMTSDRVGKLIGALHELENFVKGKSIVTGRIGIYRNLVRNLPSQMLANTVWLEDLFSDMLSSIPNTRASAIDLGLESALVLGTEGKASRAFMELFQRERGDDSRPPDFGEYYAARLKEMVKKKESGSANVPQIWSIPVLFLRYKPRLWEQWKFMNHWLGVIQECFNSSDQQTRLEANLAWNRLVFAVQPDEKTSPNLITMLCRPLLEQLKRKNKSTSKSKARKAALSSIYILLYYSLQPSSTVAQLDLYWDQYVIQVVGKALTPPITSDSSEPARQDLMDACYILKALFNSTIPRPWKKTRAMELSAPEPSMEATELPALDSKWLRKNAPRVFPVLEPILERLLYWDLNDDGETITTLWRTYITSIASPAIKEVKVSNETMACIASTFNFLYRFWHIGSRKSVPLSSDSSANDFLGNFSKIISATIEGLGVLPFTEKLLSIGSQDTFVVIATPSHRPKSSRGEILCPLHHLFVLLTSVCPGLHYDWTFSQMVRQILTPFFEARPSSKARMDLVKDLLQLLPTEKTEPCKIIWQVLADFATFATDMRDENGFASNGSNDQPLGADYRSALKILESGLDLSPEEPLPGWKSLFEALVTSSTIDAGEGGRAIAVIEPLSRAFVAKLSSNEAPLISLTYCRMIVSKANYPKDRQALDAARRKIWGAANITPKASGFDPYNHLYDYLRQSLESSYIFFTKDRTLAYSDVLSAATALLSRCSDSTCNNVLIKLQKGICCWIQDDQVKLSGGTSLSQAVTSLWAKIVTLFPPLVNVSTHTKILSDLQILVCAGLESRHRTIVNSSIKLWNSTFGTCQDGLEYPPKVLEALNRLRPIAELQMPGLSESYESEESTEPHQPLNFADTQEDASNFFGSTASDSIFKRQSIPGVELSPYSKAKTFTPQVIIEMPRTVSVKRLREETPESGNRKSKKRNSTPSRLRHDDSQVQFEAIESSPIADTILDSQLLTERQKEVKERQQAEAAMFPDIRSSPRPKSAQKRVSSVELPLHRSSSKSRSGGSPRAERQTTPTVAPQAEYDEYVNSSPTPTRALHPQGENAEEPPSSPPEERIEQQFVSYEDETEIPSSPPEQAEEPEIDTTISFDPSAQVDPLAVQNDRIVSTFEITSDEQDNSTILDSFTFAKPVQMENHHLDSANIEARPSRTISRIQTIRGAEPAAEGPTTPVNAHEGTPVPQHTPKTPVFHDALQSPASSSKQTVDEEVFQDAVSSPSLNVEGTKGKKGSSPLSNFDESSILRLMTEFDQGSGRPKPSTMAEPENEDKAVEEFASSPKDSAPIVEAQPETTGDLHKEPDMPLEEVEKDQNPNNTSDKVPQTSSLPSLIPETPGTKAPMIVAKGVEYDPEDTIVVTIPDGFDDHIATFKRKKGGSRKRSSLGLGGTPTPKKSKLWDPKEKENEVPDSQELQIHPPSSMESSIPKKPRGRPRRGRSSQTSSQSQSENEPIEQLDANYSFSSVDLDASLPNADADDASANAPASSQREAAETKDVIPEIVIEQALNPEPSMQDESISGSPIIEDVVMEDEFPNSTHGKKVPISSNNEVIEETTIDNTSSLEDSSPAAPKPVENIERPEDVDDLQNMVVSPEEVAQTRVPQVNASSQIESIVEIPTAQSVMSKLQSLIGDLGKASLTREEVNTIEDMFMDAKQHLYGAGRRGRES